MLEGEFIAKVRIAADGKPGDTVPPKFIPDFIDKEQSRGILYSDCLDDMDIECPICIYTGDDSTLPAIILKEETGYEITITFNEGCNGSLDLKYYEECMDGAKLKLSKFEDNLAFLTFHSYVGKGFLKVDLGKRGTVSIPFEVRSSKIGYRQEYPRMLEDVAKFSIERLLYSKSPLYRGYRPESMGKPTKYEDFLLLEYFFDSMGFVDAFEQVSRNLNSRMESDSSPTPVFQAVNIDIPDVIANWSSGPVIELDGSTMGGCIPEVVNSRYYFDNVDTPENRVVKDMLLFLDYQIRELTIVEDNKPEKERSLYVKELLSEMSTYVDQCLSHDWLQSVGSLTELPSNSTVLQFKRGYSDIFVMYQMLGLGAQFSQEDLPNLLKGHGRKVHSVYEYWCLIQLIDCLKTMSVENPEILRNDGDFGRISLCGKGMKFKLCDKFDSLNVILHYNKQFKPKEEDYRTYSIVMRPDYTLEVFPDDRYFTCIVNFDAKYKVKPQKKGIDDDALDGTCWEYDLYKMHTYRDAIMRSVGSYVLYPGISGKSKKLTKLKCYQRADKGSDSYIPSVGFISLIPGNPDNNLRNHLELIFAKIANKEFESGEEFF